MPSAPRSLLVGASLLLGLAAQVASATGFEKPVVISGKYGGVAGASTSSVTGVESLMFNPAGLAGTASAELGLAGSPFLTRKTGPVLPDPDAPTRGVDGGGGKSSLAYPGGVLAAARVLDGLGVGVGYFAVGGGGGEFGELDLGPAFTLHPELAGGLAMSELAVATGYELAPGLRVGAAWRVTFVKAEIKAAVVLPSAGPDPGPPVLYAFALDDLSDVDVKGFRLGAQYQPPGASWGLGASFRSRVGWTVRGESSARSQVAGDPAVSDVPAGRVEVSAALPWQAAVGGHWDPIRSVRLLGQYEFTNSSDVRELRYSGEPIGILDPRLLTSPVAWLDMHTFRLGVEHAREVGVFRAGYAMSTQVTRTDRANFIGIPPGPSHTVTAGAGRRFLDDRLGVDVALDFSRDAGTARGSTQPGFLDGEYSVWAATLHASMAYRF